MRLKNFSIFSVMFILFLAILVGCSSGGTDTTAKPDDTKGGTSKPAPEEEEEENFVEFSNKEATIKVATPWGSDHFMSRIGDYASEALPHVTIEHVDWNGSAENLQELYAENIIPDVFLAFSGQGPLEELESVHPLDEMIELYNVDLSYITPVYLDEVRSRDKQGRLVGLPGESGLLGLYYNKEVFDLFGVPYPDPEESMSWEKTIELARQMTGVRNGVNYCGLEFGQQAWAPLNQLAVNKTDPETGAVLIENNAEFTKYMNLMQSFFSIPDIQHEDCGFGARTMAMSIGWHGFMAQNWLGGETVEEAIENMKDMDILPLPTWADAPNIGPMPAGIHPWEINAYSENKEAALQFLLVVAGEDYQLKLAQDGTPSILFSQESIDQFGANNAYLESKNTKALFHNTPATPPAVKSVWDKYVDFDMAKFVESGVDIHESLRVTAEESQIKIQDAMNAQ